MEAQFTYLTFDEESRRKRLNIGVYIFPTNLDIGVYTRVSLITLNKLLESVKLTFDVNKSENDLDYGLLRLTDEPTVKQRKVDGIHILGFRYHFEYAIETSDLETRLESVGFKKILR
ncbi:MAG: hypothetical protein Q8R00_01570 [Candidatus Nanoarchaeia archaeon]|nr:hypothetical protein [Candidatus Nanoarchaeia archaeon]